MINITYIYFLHLGDGIPTYIGKTVCPKSRLNLHKQTNILYEMEIIDNVDSKEWKFWEEFYIELFLSWGFILTNKTRKGRGCGTRKCEWADKISQSNKGKQRKWRDENEIEKRRQNQLGKKYTLGYKYTSEQKEKCIAGKRKKYIQYDLKGNIIKEWFNTQGEIAKYFNKDSASLSQHLKGKQKTAYGFIWKVF